MCTAVVNKHSTVNAKDSKTLHFRLLAHNSYSTTHRTIVLWAQRIISDNRFPCQSVSSSASVPHERWSELKGWKGWVAQVAQRLMRYGTS